MVLCQVNVMQKVEIDRIGIGLKKTAKSAVSQPDSTNVPKMLEVLDACAVWSSYQIRVEVNVRSHNVATMKKFYVCHVTCLGLPMAWFIVVVEFVAKSHFMIWDRIFNARIKSKMHALCIWHLISAPLAILPREHEYRAWATQGKQNIYWLKLLSDCFLAMQ